MRHKKATAFGERVQEYCVWHARSNALARDPGRKGKTEKKEHVILGETAAYVIREIECTGDNFSYIDTVEDDHAPASEETRKRK